MYWLHICGLELADHVVKGEVGGGEVGDRGRTVTGHLPEERGQPWVKRGRLISRQGGKDYKQGSDRRGWLYAEKEERVGAGKEKVL